jgi:hypothetical protein
MGLRGRKSSRRLVKKEKARLFGESQRHLDLSLISVREVLDQFVSLLPQAKLLQKTVATIYEGTIGRKRPKHDKLRPNQGLASHEDIV